MKIVKVKPEIDDMGNALSQEIVLENHYCRKILLEINHSNKDAELDWAIGNKFCAAVK